MVLPVPVVLKGPANFEFLDLSKVPSLFEQFQEAWVGHGLFDCAEDTPQREPIAVVQVGNFDASFLPSQSDFQRLDSRFRLDPEVLSQLPQYGDFGFAVFQLRPGHQQVHPMGFSFHTRMPKHLFFPTVHVHDGELHDRERFDHVLFCQTKTDLEKSPHPDCLSNTQVPGSRPFGNWELSLDGLGSFVEEPSAVKSLMSLESRGYRRYLVGPWKNVDIVVPAEPLDIGEFWNGPTRDTSFRETKTARLVVDSLGELHVKLGSGQLKALQLSDKLRELSKQFRGLGRESLLTPATDEMLLALTKSLQALAREVERNHKAKSRWSFDRAAIPKNHKLNYDFRLSQWLEDWRGPVPEI